MPKPLKTVTIKQGCMLPATPEKVYEMFMDSKQHTSFTGDEASLSPNIGGSFSTFSGYSNGQNIELIAGKKIVQSWRAEDWPAGHYSTITITLLPAPGGNTKLLFTQTDVPSSLAKSIAQGWKEYYWEKMKEALSVK